MGRVLCGACTCAVPVWHPSSTNLVLTAAPRAPRAYSFELLPPPPSPSVRPTSPCCSNSTAPAIAASNNCVYAHSRTHTYALTHALTRSEAQLHLALLHYFKRDWDDAWLELGIWLERFAGSRPTGCNSGCSSATASGAESGGGALISSMQASHHPHHSHTEESGPSSAVEDGGDGVAASGAAGDEAAGGGGGGAADCASQEAQARLLLEKIRLQLVLGGAPAV